MLELEPQPTDRFPDLGSVTKVYDLRLTEASSRSWREEVVVVVVVAVEALGVIAVAVSAT
jgi:hypothetical protein